MLRKHRLRTYFALMLSTSLDTSLAFARQTNNTNVASASSNNSMIAEDLPATSVPDKTDDIIVTARRRDEKLQDVPISVQAFSGQSLLKRGVLNPSDLVSVTPTLKVSSSSQRRAAPSYELRGISSTESAIGQDSPVAFYINEVAVPRPAGTNGAFYDVENVQVLLGPQGTLFGRNAAAGAILLSSKKPTDRLEGEVQTGLGNYEFRTFAAVLNLPVSDKFALRFAGQRNIRQGFTRDITNNRDLDDQNDWSGRVSFRLSLGRLENIGVADYYRSDTNGSGNQNIALRLNSDPRAVGQGASTIANINGDLRVLLQRDLKNALGPRAVALSPDFHLFDKVKAYGFSNITTFELNDKLSIKNIFGYRYANVRTKSDLDGTQLLGVHTYVEESSRAFSDELQLQGTGLSESLIYIAGLYYFREAGAYISDAQQFVPSSFTVLNAHGVNTSYSAFAQATYKAPFLAGLSITGGLRYTSDKRRIAYRPPTAAQRDQIPGTPACTYTIPNPGGTPANIPNPTCSSSARDSFNKVTYTVSADYKLTPTALLYAAHRRGYRSGGLNSRANGLLEQTIPFGPETVTDIEAGVKATWQLGNGVRFLTNGAIYYINYDDIQRTVTTATVLNGQTVTTNTILNAAKARLKGAEANVELQFGDYFSISAYFAHNKAMHKRFDTLIGGLPTTLRNKPFGSLANSGGITATTTPIDNDRVGRISMTTNLAYSGQYFNTTAINLTNPNLPFLDQSGRVPPRIVVNASVDWAQIKGSGFSAQLFVRNLFNKQYLVSTLALRDGPSGFSGGLFGEPRMYGASLKFAFQE